MSASPDRVGRLGGRMRTGAAGGGTHRRIADALCASRPTHAGARGELRRCQLRQRLPGANHTVVAATAACRTLCVVTNEIRFLPRITLSVWISRALLFGDSRWARQYAPVQRRRHLTLTAVQRCRTSERRWLSRRGAQSHQLHKQRGKRSLRKLRAGGTASARRA